jgi:tryptophan 2,3-dioxygenase
MRAPLPPTDPAYDRENNHYWRYHGLDTLLGCKRPVTASVDEDLFITIHQMCELAFHQMILDLDRALDAWARALEEDATLGDTGEAVYFLHRVVRLWDLAIRGAPVLMTLRGFSEFRAALGPSSGFQSIQFRRVEIQSGVDRPFWKGGTNDAEGRTHPAESAFDARYGAQLAEWFGRYRTRSLAALFEQTLSRFPGASRAARVQAFRSHAPALAAELRAYDKAQLRFHRVHLQLAVQQLAMVGVEVGTGGTTFKDYLAKYGRDVAPLFRGLGRT